MPIPNTKTRTSHGLSIVARGVTIGLIQTWGVRLSRAVTHLFELNPTTSGNPVDLVPGNVGDLTLTVRRVDLHAKKMEEAFGGVKLDMLSDQNNPFELYETWKTPNGSVEKYVYTGCWFTAIGRTFDVTGNRVVIAEGTIAYLERKSV
jgi:hypothetical protein